MSSSISTGSAITVTQTVIHTVEMDDDIELPDMETENIVKEDITRTTISSGQLNSIHIVGKADVTWTIDGEVDTRYDESDDNEEEEDDDENTDDDDDDDDEDEEKDEEKDEDDDVENNDEEKNEDDDVEKDDDYEKKDDVDNRDDENEDDNKKKDDEEKDDKNNDEVEDEEKEEDDVEKDDENKEDEEKDDKDDEAEMDDEAEDEADDEEDDIVLDDIKLNSEPCGEYTRRGKRSRRSKRRKGPINASFNFKGLAKIAPGSSINVKGEKGGQLVKVELPTESDLARFAEKAEQIGNTFHQIGKGVMDTMNELDPDNEFIQACSDLATETGKDDHEDSTSRSEEVNDLDTDEGILRVMEKIDKVDDDPNQAQRQLAPQARYERARETVTTVVRSFINASIEHSISDNTRRALKRVDGMVETVSDIARFDGELPLDKVQGLITGPSGPLTITHRPSEQNKLGLITSDVTDSEVESSSGDESGDEESDL